MNKYIIALFCLFGVFNVSLSANSDDLLFKGGHTIKLTDSLTVSVDSVFVLSDQLNNWSPYLNNISYDAIIFSKREVAPDGMIKFTERLGGVKFKDGKYTEENFAAGKIETKLLFTANFNNYKARIDCNLNNPGLFYLVTATKGLNSSSEYYEKYSYWVIVVNKVPETEINDVVQKSGNKEFTDKKADIITSFDKNKLDERPQQADKQESDGNKVWLKAGASFESRYFWRGLDLSKSPTIEPEVQLGYGPAKLKISGVYGLSEKVPQNNSKVEYSKINFGLSYQIDARFGKLILGIDDYYFPYAGIKFLKFEDDGKGAHTPEINITIADIFKQPVELFGAVNCYNDSDRSWYLEAKYKIKIGEYGLNLFAGGTKGPSSWYNTKTWAVVNLGFTAEKSVVINENISFPVSVSYYLNTYSEENCLVFKISF